MTDKTTFPAESRPPDVNRPDVVAEVTEAFEAYEAALMSNDVATLDALFWRDPRTVRFGADGPAYGFDAIAAFRRDRDVAGLARVLERVVITSFGENFATALCAYRRTATGRVGWQSQSWVRMAEGWRIVAAHVSLGPVGGEIPPA
ncbi:oxalurate catabolism protein HpxZ [Azospirillum cavernae]|uniref:Oxalurate catabolism protein HpxZ n=1 Tax=Azospirillum cavernae TaxID=2320860 RepID=A0A418VUR2_9PROT|nr:oxalurate catabolism protein HpxZ [Azospirillum cavernae]RJF80854.1 oxalurate catabolism protein HpxZ [Azospirillum cavernae]